MRTGLLLIAAMLAGCATSSEQPELPVDVDVPFSASGEQPMPDRWWTAFDDNALNEFVDQALASNLDLKSAYQRLRQFEALADRESAALFPSVDAFAEGQSIGTGGGDGPDEDVLRLGLTAEYEVDLWGRISSAAEAERLRARAGFYDYRTAAVTLSAEVSRTWYQLVEANQQLELVDAQVKTNGQVLSLLKVRFGTGQRRVADILRQQQLLEATREQRHVVLSRIGTLEHQLSVLLGRTPQAGIDYSARELVTLPPPPRTGLPVDLVQRRPDVQSAFNQLLAADRDVAVAVSRQFPRLSFTASLTTEDNDVTDLFDTWVRSFAANLTQPLFDAGERDAEVERTEAIEQQRLYEYGQAILTAFREVEDALIQESKQRDRIQSISMQLDLAEQSYEQLRQQYMNGMVSYLEALTALTEVQSLRRDLLTARRQLIEFRIALYRALAGGFETQRETQAEPAA